MTGDEQLAEHLHDHPRAAGVEQQHLSVVACQLGEQRDAGVELAEQRGQFFLAPLVHHRPPAAQVVDRVLRALGVEEAVVVEIDTLTEEVFGERFVDEAGDVEAAMEHTPDHGVVAGIDDHMCTGRGGARRACSAQRVGQRLQPPALDHDRAAIRAVASREFVTRCPLPVVDDSSGSRRRRVVHRTSVPSHAW